MEERGYCTRAFSLLEGALKAAPHARQFDAKWMLLLGTSACASCCRWATSGFGLQLANIDQHFWELLTHAKEPQGIIPFQGGQCFSEDVRGLGIGLDILQLDVVFIKHFSDGT